MGCIFGCDKSFNDDNENIIPQPKEYSWDQRRRLDPKNYTIENCDNSCTGRLPGTINGEQFIIQNCKNTRIYLLDHIGTINIDDCADCDMVIGPVKNSIFIRDCVRCNIIVACQQFRTRDCRNLNVFLSCASQPIIEATSKFKVGCYQLYYPKLTDQFIAANLSVFNCNWSDIYDFTPFEDHGSNFSFLPEESVTFDFIKCPSLVSNSSVITNHGDEDSSEMKFMEELRKIKITDSRKMSVVPYTFGNRRLKLTDRSVEILSLIILFYDNGEERNLAFDLINYVNEKYNDAILIKTRQSKLTLETATDLFGQKLLENCLKGPIISLEYLAPMEIGTIVTQFQKTHSNEKDLSHFIYVSPDVETSKKQIVLINNITNMSMNT